MVRNIITVCLRGPTILHYLKSIVNEMLNSYKINKIAPLPLRNNRITIYEGFILPWIEHAKYD